jgi:hypothetical protein
MKKKRGMKELLKNNFISLIFIVILICLGAVIAGNVIVKEGAVDVSNNLNVSGNAFISGNLTSLSLTSGRIPYVTTGGKITDSINLTYNPSGSNINLGNDALTFNAVTPTIATNANSSTIILKLKMLGAQFRPINLNPMVFL